MITVATTIRTVIIVVWADLQPAVEADPQPPQLQPGHDHVGGHGADHQAGDPQRLVQGERDDHVHDHVDRRQLGRDPRALEGEEGAAEEQVDAGEGQAEGEPEQRHGDEMGRAV